MKVKIRFRKLYLWLWTKVINATSSKKWIKTKVKVLNRAFHNSLNSQATQKRQKLSEACKLRLWPEITFLASPCRQRLLSDRQLCRVFLVRHHHPRLTKILSQLMTFTQEVMAFLTLSSYWSNSSLNPQQQKCGPIIISNSYSFRLLCPNWTVWARNTTPLCLHGTFAVCKEPPSLLESAILRIVLNKVYS